MRRRETFLSYGRQTIDDEDIEAVVETLRSPYLTQGPKIEQFERAVAEYVGAKYAVAFCNGTAALHGACRAAGIGTGDEAITSPITFAATSNAVLYCGGRPVFADIDERTYNLDPAEIERHITDRTKAVIPVDFAGRPADLDAILEIARRHGLVVIEDAAHALGASSGGRKVGSLAHMTIFSFHPVKPVTTGEGGIVTTDSEYYYERLKRFRSHGIVRTPYSEDQGAWHYEMLELGYNYRMTDIQAALGISQLKKLDGFLRRRREIAGMYHEMLSDIPGIITPPADDDRIVSGWHLYMIRIDSAAIGLSRKQVFEAMRQRNIGVHVHYIPVYWHPYYHGLGYEKGLCPKAETYYEQALTLPIFPGMSDEDVEDVVLALREVVNERHRIDR
jgi:UDP-4-amino-4,6-dideoxy-N-acetyl-beta-L-altrosamine transaminase